MNKKLNNFIQLTITVLLLSVVYACAPRGETQSLSDILSKSRDRFRSAELMLDNSPVKDKLSVLAQKLVEIEKIQDPTALKPATAGIKDSLSDLLAHTGYTVRPALSEIVDQYRVISNGSAVTTDSALAGSPEIRLLLARTYSVLASELETGKFSL
jgi:hypothetical protein